MWRPRFVVARVPHLGEHAGAWGGYTEVALWADVVGLRYSSRSQSSQAG